MYKKISKSLQALALGAIAWTAAHAEDDTLSRITKIINRSPFIVTIQGTDTNSVGSLVLDGNNKRERDGSEFDVSHVTSIQYTIPRDDWGGGMYLKVKEQDGRIVTDAELREKKRIIYLWQRNNDMTNRIVSCVFDANCTIQRVDNRDTEVTILVDENGAVSIPLQHTAKVTNNTQVPLKVGSPHCHSEAKLENVFKTIQPGQTQEITMISSYDTGGCQLQAHNDDQTKQATICFDQTFKPTDCSTLPECTIDPTTGINYCDNVKLDIKRINSSAESGSSSNIIGTTSYAVSDSDDLDNLFRTSTDFANAIWRATGQGMKITQQADDPIIQQLCPYIYATHDSQNVGQQMLQTNVGNAYWKSELDRVCTSYNQVLQAQKNAKKVFNEDKVDEDPADFANAIWKITGYGNFITLPPEHPTIMGMCQYVKNSSYAQNMKTNNPGNPWWTQEYNRVCNIHNIKENARRKKEEEAKERIAYKNAVKALFEGGKMNLPGVTNETFGRTFDFANAVWRVEGYSSNGKNAKFLRGFCNYMRTEPYGKKLLEEYKKLDPERIDKYDPKRVPQYANWCGITLHGFDKFKADYYARNKKFEYYQAQFPGIKAPLFKFSGAYMPGANFSGADLTSAWFGSCWIPEINFSPAINPPPTKYTILRNAFIADSVISNGNFTQANLEKALFVRTKGNKINFQNANLQGASFDNCSFDAPQFQGKNTNLQNSVFKNNTRLYWADFTNANLKGADLRGAIFSGKDAQGKFEGGADFTGADLSGANFMGVNLTGVIFSGANLSGAIWTDGRKCMQYSTGECATLQRVNYVPKDIAQQNSVQSPTKSIAPGWKVKK
jgi:uncharacterized protein YjbI with pentapeptide repeats